MNNEELRNRLLELEPCPDDLKASVREVFRLRERPLKPWEWPALVLTCLFLAAVLIGGPILLPLYCPDFMHKVPVHILAGLPILYAIVCWVLVLTLLSLKRGARRFRDDQVAVYAGAAFVLYVFVANVFVDSKHVDAMGLAVSILAVIGIIWVRIEEAEIRLREQLLRNELAVARLAEIVGAREKITGD
jgi:hypothetical protein